MQTFAGLINGFLHYSEPKASWIVYRRLADQYFDAWPEHPSFNHIEDWHRSLADRPHQANKGLSMLKACYTWAIRRGLYPGPNPASGVKRHPTVSRERVMSTQEVALLLSCLDMLPKKLATLLLVLLTTGCRLSEARVMQRQHVDLVTGAWLQPLTKNGRPHTTYLPTQARAALVALDSPGEFLFPGVYEHCWSRAGVEKVWSQVRGSLGMPDVRLHDFRRTLATHLYRATHDEYLVKRCINHVNRNVTAIYVRISNEEWRRPCKRADRFEALNPKGCCGAVQAKHSHLPLKLANRCL
jgi:integrase